MTYAQRIFRLAKMWEDHCEEARHKIDARHDMNQNATYVECKTPGCRWSLSIKEDGTQVTDRVESRIHVDQLTRRYYDDVVFNRMVDSIRSTVRNSNVTMEDWQQAFEFSKQLDQQERDIVNG